MNKLKRSINMTTLCLILGPIISMIILDIIVIIWICFPNGISTKNLHNVFTILLDLNYFQLLISILILMCSYLVLGIPTRFLIFLPKDSITYFLKKYNEFELTDYFEKNKYMSLSSLLTVYTVCYSVIYYIGSLNKDTYFLINDGKLKIALIIIIFLDSVITVSMYNSGLKRVKKAFYELYP